MVKVLAILSQVILLTTLFIYLPSQTVRATNCTFTYNPDPPNQNMGDLSVTIKSDDLKSGTYRVQFLRAKESYSHIRDINFGSGTGKFTIEKPRGWTDWLAGQYTIYFIEQDKTGQPEKIAVCQTSFTITDIPISSSCKASIETKPIEPDTKVVLKVEGINSDTYNIFIEDEVKFTITGNGRFDLGTFSAKTLPYTVTIKKDSRLQCNPVSFTVAPRGSGGGGQVGTISTGEKKCTPEDFKEGKCSLGGGEPCDEKGGRGPAIKTAIGCIHTNPNEFVKDFLTFIIGIAGGLAFLMMLLGAFQMLTSAGNPDSLNAGRERLTSAIIGLLFVIFAVLLLQIIGVDILKIPGFAR